MRAFVLGTVQNLALGMIGAMPGLFTVLLIFLLARFIGRLIALWLAAIEQGRIKTGWIYPETAAPSRRLLVGLVWIFALVMAYPYLPGSGTDAFKGVSVLVGLMLTRWEATAATLHYTPNRWLVLLVTFVVSARVVYGLWRSWTVAAAGVSGTPMVLAFGIPESLAAGGTVIGYYVAYGLGVRRRIRKWQNGALRAR